jgi:hypothetical protein
MYIINIQFLRKVSFVLRWLEINPSPHGHWDIGRSAYTIFEGLKLKKIFSANNLKKYVALA